MRRLSIPVALLLIGCTSSSSDVGVDDSPSVERPAELAEVTLYLASMNRQLKIL